jgi:hypothetical protein
VRLWLYVAALAALAGAGLYLHHLQEKASRVDAAEARAEAAESKAVALSETYAKARAADVATASELSAMRADMAANALTFAQELKSKPLIKEVIREVNGVQVACPERDAVRYHELFNQAVSGAASP